MAEARDASVSRGELQQELADSPEGNARRQAGGRRWSAPARLDPMTGLSKTSKIKRLIDKRQQAQV